MKTELNGPMGIGIIAVIVVLIIALGMFFMNRGDAPAGGKATGGAAATAKPFIPSGANANRASGGGTTAAHNE